MAEKKAKLQPVRKGNTSPGEYARRARNSAARLRREGYRFTDSVQFVRADRDSRV